MKIFYYLCNLIQHTQSTKFTGQSLHWHVKTDASPAGKEDKFYYPGKIKKGEACYEKKKAGGRRFFSEKLRPVFLQSWFLTVKPQFTGVDRNGEFHQQGIDEGAGGPDSDSNRLFNKCGYVLINLA